MSHGLCAKYWFGIAQIEAVVAAVNVDAVRRGIHPKEEKGERAIALQNVNAVQAFVVMKSYQTRRIKTPKHS
jgi:hypothetical protein